MSKLRESAKDAPHCFSCGLPNPDGNLLCLAHSNALADGRGAYHKSNDLFGAIVCKTCHDEMDGRSGGLAFLHKREAHYQAWVQTMRWWINTGRVKAT
jgi:hypothetical protein